MISITNNGASIQLNGDQNVTIVKRDVTKVQSVGINVLVVRRTNGIERKTSIPYTSVNVPQTFPTAQALADYISSILGSFDTSAFVENSNGTYVAQVISSPFPIPDTDIENSDGSYTNSIPSADPTPFQLPDIDVIIDSVVEGQVPSVQDVSIDLVNQDATPISPTSVAQTGNTFEIEITEPRILNNRFNVLTGDDTITYTIQSTDAGTITSVNNGGLTSIVIEVNAVPVTAPFALANTDTLEITFDTALSDTSITLTGTYV